MEAAKAELLKLQQQRSAIEAEINERSARLNGPGQPGMQDSLIDKEGFPRADIDVHGVRIDRNAIIRLTNDHKAISKQLEELLHKLHALARDAKESGAPLPGSTPGAAPTAANGAAAAAAAPSQVDAHEDKKPRLDAAAAAASQPRPAAAAAAAAAMPAATQGSAATAAVPLRPFAVVDEVAEGSPAAAAGIQLGDQLCRFGAAKGGSGNELQQVAQELQAREDQPVQTVFLRAGHQVQLELVPRRWEGRGLLGCHLRAL